MNSIHPTAIIAGDVRLGEDNVIGPFAVVTGPVEIGHANWFGAGVVIGSPPEVRSFPHPRADGEDEPAAGIRIGNRTVIREYAQIHQGWKKPTRIGDDAFIMNQCYIAHDSDVQDGVTMASGTRLAGHSVVRAFATLGLGSLVHQRRIIGAGAMVGMGSVVTRDLPAFALAYGNPARVRGVNSVVLDRLVPDDALRKALSERYDAGRLDLAGLEDLPGWLEIAHYFV